MQFSGVKFMENDKLESLKTAKLCLKRIAKEKDEKYRNALMYQFCLQMRRFCNLTAKESKSRDVKHHLKSQASTFGAIAKIYRGLGE